jgi:hypothetical protein
MVKTCENTGLLETEEIYVPTDCCVVEFGTDHHTFMVRTTGHGVPYDASEQCEEGKEGEGKGGCVYNAC